MLNLYKLEIERVEYLLRSYLRTRLLKIDRFYQYILTSEDESEREKLSAHELEYAVKYSKLITKQLNTSFLQFLPKNAVSREEGMIRSAFVHD